MILSVKQKRNNKKFLIIHHLTRNRKTQCLFVLKVLETSYSTSKLGVGVMVSKTPVGDMVRHHTSHLPHNPSV